MLSYKSIKKEATSKAINLLSKAYNFDTKSRKIEKLFGIKLVKILEDKKSSYQYIAVEVYDLIRSWFDKYDDDKIKGLIDTYNESPNINTIHNLKFDLKVEFNNLNKRYGENLENFDFNKNKSKYFNSLGLVDFFIRNCDRYKLDKYIYLTEKYDQKPLYNNRISLYDFSSPKIDILFPEAVKALKILFVNRFRLLIIELVLNKIKPESEKNKLVRDSTFSDDSQFRYLFYEEDIFEVVNEYLDTYAKGKPNQSFFNKLRYVLINSKFKEKTLIKNNKSAATIYREEISRKFNFDQFKLDNNNLANDFIDTKNNLENISRDKKLKIIFLH